MFPNERLLRKYGESAVLKGPGASVAGKTVTVIFDENPELIDVLEVKVDGVRAEASLLTADCTGVRVGDTLTLRDIVYSIARHESDGDGLTTLTLCED
jgi:hypothetical protein